VGHDDWRRVVVTLERVVAVIATVAGGLEQVGSGYLVDGRLVLTAAHCTWDKKTRRPALRLRVIRALDGADSDVSEVIVDPELDVAVLRLASASWPADLPAPVFARVDRVNAGVLRDCLAIGYPLYQRNPGDRIRGTSELHGLIYQTDEAQARMLLMREPQVHPGPVIAPDDGRRMNPSAGAPSPWEGLSGALVFHQGRAIGVVVEHHPRQGDNALRAVPFDRLAMRASHDESARRVAKALALASVDSLPWAASRPVKFNASRISDADPRLLGVHAAIDDTPQADDGLPPYVLRDDVVDAKLRNKLRQVRSENTPHGVFVLLIGGSSVGKTRSLYEALVEVLPDWWLVHPADPDAIRNLAVTPVPRTVLWLDELQRYLGPYGEERLTAAIRTLIQAGTVLVGTLWPEELDKRQRRPASEEVDRYEDDRKLLDLADIVVVPETLSADERRRAETLAVTDPRIQIALTSTDYGMTQVLAAAPDLVRRWEHAADPYGKAVLTAAIDACRLGVTSPLAREFLAAAVPGYLTSAQRASAPAATWLDTALSYATAPLRGAATALAAVGSDRMGELVGYTVAEYLLQYGGIARAAVFPPASFWQAASDTLRNSKDLNSLAQAAEQRCRFQRAAQMYQCAAVIGDSAALRRLATLRVQADDRRGAEELYRKAAELGDTAALQDWGWLREQANDDGCAEKLYKQALDRGDPNALDGLIRLQERADDLPAAQRLVRENVGNRDAVRMVFDWLWRTGDETGTLSLARLAADRGDTDPLCELASFRLQAGDRNGAEELYREVFDRGDTYAVSYLIRLREEAGDHDEAEAIARRAADQGDINGLWTLAHVRGRAGDSAGAEDLYREADERGGPPTWRQRAELRSRAGNWESAEHLYREAADNGDVAALTERASILAGVGEIDRAQELYRDAADHGDRAARRLWARLCWRIDARALAGELFRETVKHGDTGALEEWAGLLFAAGDRDQAEDLYREAADRGGTHALVVLGRLREEAGQAAHAEGLYRESVNRGYRDALHHVARLRKADRDLAGAERLRRFGLNDDGTIADAW
jgi:hypothetical protein